MKIAVRWLVGVCVLTLALNVRAEEKKEGSSVLNYTMKSLDGKDVALSKYQGKVVLVVNVASRCGNTPQYKALQALHTKYAKDGLAIVGFPCNQFGKQEPGSSEDIAEFCTKNYGVTFDMFEKVEVNGEGQCGLYKQLTAADGKFPGPIKWNFEKFLIGRDGTVANRFAPKASPESKDVLDAIEAALAKK